MKNEIDSYGFTWPGKIESLIEAGRPTDKTLRPILQDSVNFDSTENIYIEGDNLDALKIILKSYMRRVKMIYIDPPYNTGNDFVFRDDFSQSEEESQRSLGFEDDSGRNYSSEIYRDNKKSNPRFHSEWCSMIYPRLKLAHMLLSDDGVIFISIDDNEQAKLRMICDEIFGENNFVACILWKGRGGRQDSKYFAVIHEYILCYAKSSANFHAGERIKKGDKYPKYDKQRKQRYKTQLLRKWGSGSKREDRPNLFYPITAPDGSELYPMLTATQEGRWRWGKAIMQEAIQSGHVEFVKDKNGAWTAYEKIYEGEITTKKYDTWIDDISNGTEALKELFGYSPFDYSKSPELIAQLMNMANLDRDSIILDFFAGSSTTAHAVMSLNAQDSGRRKFIMIQIAEPCPEKSEARKAGYETISQIGRERIRRAGENLMCDNQQLTTNNYTLDIGFRAFRVESSNYRNIFMYPDKLSQENISDMADNIKHDRSDMDLLFMCAANFGLPMSLPYHAEIVDGFTVHIYGDNDIAACFGENISEEAVKFVAKLKAGHSVFRESCFDGVCSRINLEQIFDAYSDGKKMMIL